MSAPRRSRRGMVALVSAAAVVSLTVGAPTPARAQQGSTNWTSQNLNLDNNR